MKRGRPRIHMNNKAKQAAYNLRVRLKKPWISKHCKICLDEFATQDRRIKYCEHHRFSIEKGHKVTGKDKNWIRIAEEKRAKDLLMEEDLKDCADTIAIEKYLHSPPLANWCSIALQHRVHFLIKKLYRVAQYHGW